MALTGRLIPYLGNTKRECDQGKIEGIGLTHNGATISISVYITICNSRFTRS